MSNNTIPVQVKQNPKTGVYVGRAINIPSIVCQGDSREQLDRRLKAAHAKYVSFLASKENIVEKIF